MILTPSAFRSATDLSSPEVPANLDTDPRLAPTFFTAASTAARSVPAFDAPSTRTSMPRVVVFSAMIISCFQGSSSSPLHDRQQERPCPYCEVLPFPMARGDFPSAVPRRPYPPRTGGVPRIRYSPCRKKVPETTPTNIPRFPVYPGQSLQAGDNPVPPASFPSVYRPEEDERAVCFFRPCLRHSA